MGCTSYVLMNHNELHVIDVLEIRRQECYTANFFIAKTYGMEPEERLPADTRYGERTAWGPRRERCQGLRLQPQ